MCYFLTLSAPSRARQISERLRGRALNIWENTNPTIRALLPAGYDSYWVTTGQCSCDLAPSYPQSFDDEAARSKYRKSGWSQAKIERAIASQRTKARPIQVTRSHFFDALRELLPELGTVYLLGHNFSGNQTTEEVAANRRLKATLEEFIATGLSEEDTLVELRAA